MKRGHSWWTILLPERKVACSYTSLTSPDLHLSNKCQNAFFQKQYINSWSMYCMPLVFEFLYHLLLIYYQSAVLPHLLMGNNISIIKYKIMYGL